MAHLKVNTDAVVTAAKHIKSYNKQINDNFLTVQKVINQLNNCWDGDAAEAVIGDFYKIKSKYYNARYDSLNNYTNFLLEQVGEGYIQTEKTNVSLADRFK